MSLTADEVRETLKQEQLRAELQVSLARDHPAYFANFVQCVDSRSGDIFQFTMLSEEECLESNVPYHGAEWIWQREYLDWVLANDQTITLKGRQLGVTWVWGMLCLYDALFTPGADVLIYSIKETDAIEVVNRIYDMWLSLPSLYKEALGVTVLKPTRGARPSTEIVFEHRDKRVSTITGMAATKSAGHGRSAKRILFDEAARQDYARELWKAVVPAMGDTGGALGVVSTANGMSDTNGAGNFFHSLWQQAGESDYPKLQKTFIKWDKHPHRDGEWYKNVSLSSRDKAEQYPNDPDEAFLMSGSPFFDVESLFHYSREAYIGELYGFEWLVSGPGKARQAKKVGYAWNRVYIPPEKDKKYTIGADIATGKGKDYSCAWVVDLSTMEFCAQLHGKMGADQFAEQLHYLGKWYNDALVAVELGGGYGDSVVIALRDGVSGRPPYPNLYRHRQETRIDKPGAKQIGFPMTMKTRPQVLNQLEKAIREREFEALPKPLTAECQLFVHAETTPSPRAQDGANDDRVLSAAIALEMFRRFGVHENRWRPDRVEQQVTSRVRVDDPKTFAKRYGKART
jgi:hypothetical protein